MKLTFFLIAFFLILLRVGFSWAGHRGHSNENGNLLIKSDNYTEEINWSGKIRLTDDETGISSMPPGGYLKFRENDRKLSAESNLQGEVSYVLYDGRQNLSLNDSGRRFIAAVLQKIIARGFNAEGRPERIYKKGGNKALLEEIPRIQIDYAKGPYMDLLLKSDSLTNDELIGLITQINESGSDVEKRNYLGRVTRDQLRDSTLARIWFNAVDHLGTDVEKQELYKKRINDTTNTNDQWISLIQATTRLGADFEKVDLLVQIARKMPKDERVRTEYLQAAKSITEDAGYGKVMRAVQ